MKMFFSFFGIILLLVFVSCNGNQNQKEYASTDSVSINGFSGDSVKLVKTGSINLKVNDAYKSATAVSQLAQRLGGVISHQDIESTQDQSRELKVSKDSILVIYAYTMRAEITARIPAQHVEEFIDSVANLASFISGSKMDIDDKSLEYLAAGLRQQNRVQVLSSVSNQKLTSVASQALVNRKDEVAEQEIIKRQIDANVRYSTVQLNLWQNPSVRKEMMVNYTIADYKLPFYKSFADAFIAGWEYFLNFIIALTHLWVMLLLGIITWISVKYFKQRMQRIKTT